MLISECKRLHREIWFWLEKHPQRYKSDWPRWKNRGGSVDHVMNRCFACEYAMGDYMEDLLDCNDCPVKWPGYNCEDNQAGDGTGAYSLWNSTDNRLVREYFANKVRTMPWRI